MSFIDLCKNSDVAAEVTLLPIEQFGFDAAIVFSDILVVLEPMGVGFVFDDDKGPVINHPLRETKHFDSIRTEFDVSQRLHFVMETLGKVRRGLNKDTALLGFAGAPFTLASYLIEGGSSKHYAETKRLMFSDKGAWDLLMEKLTTVLVAYLKAQLNAGADAVQVFDSWVGCLSPAQYQHYVMPHMRRLFSELETSGPTIHFGTGNPALYPLMSSAGGTVMGVDWRVSLAEAWRSVGDKAIMGNLDPTALLGSLEQLRSEILAVLSEADAKPGHIFNLGHGVLPSTKPDRVKAMVEIVHEASARKL